MTNKVWVSVQSEASVLFVAMSAVTVERSLAVEVARLVKASRVSFS